MESKLNALCLVAHPDDCVIFAYSYMHEHADYTWTVAYLTYTEHDARGAEFKRFWQRRGIAVQFLEFEDHWQDNETRTFTRWDPFVAAEKCWQLAQQYDLVLTHDEHGDYGHIHHRLVHNAVQQHPRLVTFAPPQKGVTYTLPADIYSLDELPLHKDIIAGFHPHHHRNSYKET